MVDDDLTPLQLAELATRVTSLRQAEHPIYLEHPHRFHYDIGNDTLPCILELIESMPSESSDSVESSDTPGYAEFIKVMADFQRSLQTIPEYSEYSGYIGSSEYSESSEHSEYDTCLPT